MSRTNSSSLRQPLGLVLVAGLVLSIGACDGGSASSASASAVQATTTVAPPDASTGTPSGTPTGTPTDGATATSSLTPLRAPVIARAVPKSLFGLHVLSGTPAVTAGSWRLWDTGTQWAQLNPARGRYTWSHLDDVVAKGKRLGVKDFILVLGLTPRWASSRPSEVLPWDPSASPAPPKDIAYFDQYVAAVVAHNRTVLGGAITGIQVWNEANLAMFWSGTPQQMALMTAHVDRIVKAEDARYPTSARRHTTVVAPSVTLRRGSLAWGTGSCSLARWHDACFAGRYLAALKKVRGAGNRMWPVDAFAVHAYPAPQGSPNDRVAMIGLFRDRLREAGAPTRPLWDTEVNYGFAGTVISGSRAVQYVARTYLDSVRINVGRVYWYGWGPLSPGLAGITMDRGTSAAGAYATVQGWLRGSVFRGCTVTSGVRSCAFTVASGSSVRRFRVLWTDYGVHSVSVSPTVPVWRMNSRGTAVRALGSTTVRVGPTPIKVG